MLCLTGTCRLLYTWNNRVSHDKLLLVSELYNGGYLLVLCSRHPVTQGRYTRHFSLETRQKQNWNKSSSFVSFLLNDINNWIKIDQLMSLALLYHYLLLNMFRMLVHPSSGACGLLWIYFMCCIALVRCVLVLRCGSAGVASACIRIPHHPSRTTP